MRVQHFSGQVVDADNRPVPGALVGALWWHEPHRLVPASGATTDADGWFALAVEWPDDADPDAHQGLMVLNHEQTLGACSIVQPGAASTLRIILIPVILVQGTLVCPEHQLLDSLTMQIALPPPTTLHGPQVLPCIIVYPFRRGPDRFAVRLPVGSYAITSYGLIGHDSVAEAATQIIRLAPMAAAIDLGTVSLQLNPLLQQYEQPVPEWRVQAAAGVRPDLSLAELRGRWVLLEFWSAGCAPCIAEALPALMRFWAEHQDQAEQFSILTVHVWAGAEHLDDVVRALAQIEQSRWGSQRLPFPVLLLDEQTITEVFGVRGVPALRFIDPAGRLRKGLTLERFAQLLAGQ